MAASNSLMVLVAFIGYTLLQIGTSQPKNTTSIIISNTLSLVISCVMFWATGYAFAFGSSANDFLSHSRFFLIDATTADYDSWFYHFSLLAIFIAIANGGFAERLRFWIYPIIAFFAAGFLYPVSTHWAWHKEGWLQKGINNSDSKLINYQDAGGAGVIHISAGGVAVVAAILLGARPGRKDHVEGRLKPMGGETNTNIFLGGFLVLIGLGTRNVTQYSTIDEKSLSVVNSFLAASSSAFVAFLFKRSGICGENWNTKTLINAAIAGLVSVSAAPGSMYSYAGFAIGAVAGCTYTIWNVLLRWCYIDDISDTIAVNLGGGILAVLSGPLCNKKTGVFYSGKVETFQVFGWNLLGCLVFFVWHAFCTAVVLAGLAFAKKLTYKQYNTAHETGLDIHEHDEPAYPAASTFPGGEKDTNDLAILTDVGTYDFYGKPVRAHVNGSFAETKP